MNGHVAQFCNPATGRQQLGMVWNVSDHMHTPAWESRFGPALTLADYLTNRLALGRFSVLLFGNTDESLAADPMDRTGPT